MERSLVLGVDAGSTRCVVVLAELAGGSPHVIGVGKAPCAGIRRGVVVDLESVAKSVRQAVDQACLMAECPGVSRAVVSVSGAHIRSVVGSAEVAVHRPAAGVAPEDLRKVLDLAAVMELPEEREVIHVVPRAYRLDGEPGLADPLGLAGRRLEAEAHLITGASLPVRNGLRAMALAGLQVADYQVGIRAAGQALLSREEREAGVLLLDVGGTTTGVAVFDRGHLFHVAVIPVGSEHISRDLATLMHIPFGVAERLKVERGWAAEELCPEGSFELVSPSGQRIREWEDRQLAAIIGPRVSEILRLAAQQVKQSGYDGLFPAGLVLTGGGSRLHGFLEVAGDALGLPARMGAPADPLAAEPEFAVAVGLAQWGAHLMADEVAVAAAETKSDAWARLRAWFKGRFQ